jgi:beta-glucosidase
MKLVFPETFAFGTSTSAYQIETPFEHDWLNVRSRDGHVFNRTTDHEKRWKDDAAIIASVAPHYRMSLMWSKLQREPFGKFHEETKNEYHFFLRNLKARGVTIMMVLHHFTNPLWFARTGGWEKEQNIEQWLDFGKKVVNEFGNYVSSWNTFNEPNLYTSLGWIAAEFPPFRKNIFTARKVLANIAHGHERMYEYIKSRHPDTTVGISHNATVFAAENFLGKVPAKIFDWLFMEFAPAQFKSTDFFGMSYYARIGHDPFPITYLLTPKKIESLGKDHDDMWEYYPQGLKECIHRYWGQYKKPVVITENGICTSNDSKRIRAIQDYIKVIYETMQEGVDVRGYYHWSTWDNFEWSLGPTFKFGLYACDPVTKEKIKKPSADVFSALAFSHQLDLSPRKEKVMDSR